MVEYVRHLSRRELINLYGKPKFDWGTYLSQNLKLTGRDDPAKINGKYVVTKNKNIHLLLSALLDRHVPPVPIPIMKFKLPFGETPEEVAALLRDQLPFHFANPLDDRIADYERRTAGAIYSARVLRYFASQEYGGIEVEDRLSKVTQPVLVLAGRYDRACSVEASQAIARGIRKAELVVFENSAHMTYVEENDRYISVVRDFMNRRLLHSED